MPSFVTRGRVTVALLALAVTGLAAVTVNGPAPLAAHTTADTTDAWLTRLDGKYRQLFDANAPNGGIPLIHALNYYDTYNNAYKVSDRDIDAVVTFYGTTTFHGLTDAMWSKYKLGEVVNEKDASGNGATANPWRTSPVILGAARPAASIESLQRRGATFILCNNALTILSGMVAQQRGLSPEAVYADMKANILPGVTLVPGMVVAIDKAQQAGVSYHRQ